MATEAEAALSAESLIAAGYRVHRCRRGGGGDSRPLYQKAIRDGDAKLYYLNVWEYDFRDLRVDTPIAYAPEVQFSRGDLSVNVEPLFGQRATIGEVEAFFAEMYRAMAFTPYEG